jgi:hypothetical protein
MARVESDREDIMREAVSLVDRAAYRLPGFPDVVVAGFRRSGAASFYFGQEEAFHFNDLSELRRCYLSGMLIKAEKGRLVSLQRVRDESSAVYLLSSELAENQTREILCLVWNRISELQRAIADQSAHVVQQVPQSPGGDVTARLMEWIDRLISPLKIAHVPNVAGR